jgi:hypothetical protein
MQAALLLLCQYCLSHLHVSLLQAKKDFAFLQHPAKVGELLGPRTRGTRLGKEILLGSISTDMISVTLCAHLPKHARDGSQSFLPRDVEQPSGQYLDLVCDE